MTYEGIGEFIKLLDSIEEAIKPKGYTISLFEQVNTRGERTFKGKSLELRIAPIETITQPKANGEDASKGHPLPGTILERLSE